ncbi:MAG: helix-turn-helix transcriptional regulator [Devosia sp.]|uniref:helix-turn-helix transcriptional regulator n=1 Tax=Devosia sp. TaxID=1871048 RepID=UPI0024C70D0E|nr:AraC family transcriptional regulator [Devosia sp.]UYN99116.1 MAG: helix-turn-helix transcriptional regulator [Devosia sp.]
MNAILPIEPDSVCLPDILTGQAGLVDVLVYDHCGGATGARSRVRFSTHALALVLSGSKVLIDGERVEHLVAGDLIAYAPGNVLSTALNEKAAPYRSVILFFNQAELAAFLAKYVVTPARPGRGSFANLGPVPDAARRAMVAAAGRDGGHELSPAMARLTLEQVLLALLEHYGPRAFALFHRPKGRAIERLKRVVEAHWQANLTLPELAFLCGMSLSTFKRSFVLAYGQAPGRWLTGRKLDRAMRLMVEGRRASEVYDLVGYSNHSVFSQSFRKHFGVTPSQVQARSGPVPGGEPGVRRRRENAAG